VGEAKTAPKTVEVAAGNSIAFVPLYPLESTNGGLCGAIVGQLGSIYDSRLEGVIRFSFFDKRGELRLYAGDLRTSLLALLPRDINTKIDPSQNLAGRIQVWEMFG
jgi:hypothetical protein